MATAGISYDGAYCHDLHDFRVGEQRIWNGAGLILDSGFKSRVTSQDEIHAGGLGSPH
jgi:hypothetical protein